MSRPVFASLALVLTGALVTSLAGCDSAPPPGPPRLGVPDPTHGPITDEDIDGDGVPNASDNCPSIANADQREACDYVLPPPPPTGADPVSDVIERINFWREMLGLDPVEDDETLTASCAAHARYMAETTTSPTMPNLTRDEDPASPHYTEEGAEAGQVALLSYTRYPVADITRFLDLVLHRLPLIHPGLRRVGVAFDRNFLCVRADMTEMPATTHAVLWPPPDSSYASIAFPGGEQPCMNHMDPLDGADCNPGALIPTVLLPGHAISNVTASMRRVDTGADVPLLHVFHDGGASMIEGSNLLEGAIVLATPEGMPLVPTEHEVRVEATIDGEPQTYRWRFRAGPAIDQDVMCDVFGRANFTFDDAVEVTPSSFVARICDRPMFYRLRGTGSFRITMDYDPRVGDLGLHAFDGSRVEIGGAAENDGHEVVEGVPGGGYFEVRGEGGATGAYVILVEAM